MHSVALIIVCIACITIGAFKRPLRAIVSRISHAHRIFKMVSYVAPQPQQQQQQQQQQPPPPLQPPPLQAPGARTGIVIIAGFEQFNVGLYRRAAETLCAAYPNIPVSVFTDRDLEAAEGGRVAEVEHALQSAKVAFVSLVFDFAQVSLLQRLLPQVPVRFCFESALELMACTQVGGFTMAPSAGSASSGPPAPIKALLKQFGSSREEDKMTGYLNLLKVGPSLLKLVPVSKGNQLYDIRVWLNVYSYWAQGGAENVVSMLEMIAYEFGLDTRPTATAASPAPPLATHTPPTTALGAWQQAEIVENPSMGLCHPLYEEQAEAHNAFLQVCLSMLTFSIPV